MLQMQFRYARSLKADFVLQVWTALRSFQPLEVCPAMFSSDWNSPTRRNPNGVESLQPRVASLRATLGERSEQILMAPSPRSYGERVEVRGFSAIRPLTSFLSPADGGEDDDEAGLTTFPKVARLRRTTLG
jgi:hypothetical protein